MGIEALFLAIAIPSVLTGIGLGTALMTVAINGAVQANRRNKEYYKRLNAMLDSSPAYSSVGLMTQTNNCLSVPITYGEVKVAGNTIWQGKFSYAKPPHPPNNAETTVDGFATHKPSSTLPKPQDGNTQKSA
jgi:hypothetical protein